MHKLVKQYLDKCGGCHYFAFRLLVGLMFFLHGGQKLFGWFSDGPLPLVSLMGLAGIIELVAGAAIAMGIFTRLMALFSGVTMLVAYFMMHASQGLNPLVNKGELALLYLAAFLVMIAMGNGKWSIEKTLLKKEIF